MKTSNINASDAPRAIGGYSQAYLVERPVRFLFISGQIPETPGGDTPADFESQCRLVWKNLIAQLTAAEMDVSSLTKITIFLSSRQHAEASSAIRNEYLKGHSPALTVIIAEIYDEKWLLEIEAVAAA